MGTELAKGRCSLTSYLGSSLPFSQSCIGRMTAAARGLMRSLHNLTLRRNVASSPWFPSCLLFRVIATDNDEVATSISRNGCETHQNFRLRQHIAGALLLDSVTSAARIQLDQESALLLSRPGPQLQMIGSLKSGDVGAGGRTEPKRSALQHVLNFVHRNAREARQSWGGYSDMLIEGAFDDTKRAVVLSRRRRKKGLNAAW